MTSLLFGFFLITFVPAPFFFMVYLAKTIEKIVKGEDWDRSALKAGVCLLWVMGCVAAFTAYMIG